MSQTEFEQAHKELIAEFVRSVPECLEKTHAVTRTIEPVSQHCNLNATLMSGFLIGNLKKKFMDQCFKDSNGRFKLVTKSSILYVKKLDKNLKPSNVDTLNSTMIIKQLSDTGSDLSTNIFLGYTTEDYSVITGIYAVCIKDDEIEWQSNLTSPRIAATPEIDAEPIDTKTTQTKHTIQIRKAE